MPQVLIGQTLDLEGLSGTKEPLQLVMPNINLSPVDVLDQTVDVSVSGVAQNYHRVGAGIVLLCKQQIRLCFVLRSFLFGNFNVYRPLQCIFFFLLFCISYSN